MRIYLDYKTSVWERIAYDVPDNFLDTLDIEGKEIYECKELFDNFIPGHYETLLDTSDDMSLEDNNNNSTVEIVLDGSLEKVVKRNNKKDNNSIKSSIEKPQDFFDYLESIPTNDSTFTDEIRQNIIDRIYKLLNL